MPLRNGFCGGKRGEEYALCLVSNRFEAEFAAPSPEQQEQYLAEQLVGLMSAYAAKNGASDEYVFGLEFGGESIYSCRSISVAAADGGYSVSFTLAANAANGAVCGEYTAKFTAENENGREFLRFAGIIPANS